VTVSPAAQVIINSLTDNGATIDITNVVGQFEVNLAVQPNGQNISSVQAWVCEAGETVTACATRSGSPAAQQTFGTQGAQAGAVQLYINSAAFAAPDFTTGANANTTYKNGLKTIVATATTAGTSVPTASNALNSVNFNNPDGWTIQWNLPNRAQDAAGVTWYGGPDTPDASVSGATSGTGSFTVVPVIYTPNRDVLYATINIASQGGLACGSNMIDSVRPFRATYGAITRSTTTYAFSCSGTASTDNTSGYVPTVIGAVDNTNAGSYPGAGTARAVGTSIFTRVGGGLVAGNYYTSPSYNVTGQNVPGDYSAPVVSRFDVRGSNTTGGSQVDSGWVTGTYAFDQRTSLGAQLRYQIADGGTAGVGLLATRNTLFTVCNRPATISTSAPTTCPASAAVASGPLSSTVASLGLTEHATDVTNRAYFAVASETDRLGNRATTNPYTYTTATPTLVNATAGQTASAGVNAAPSYQEFGVDLTAPAIVAIPNTGTNAISGFARTDADSIYASAASALGGTQTADGTVFGIRFTDTRSGFFNCAATTCPAAVGQRGGSYQITRRIPTIPTTAANGITSVSLVNAATSATLTANSAINASPTGFDATIQQFTTPIFGDAARYTATAALSPAIGVGVDGYYTFSGTLVDRAGNTTTIPSRTVAIDNSNPTVTGLIPPASLPGAATAAFTIYGTDNLEAIGGDLSIRYPTWDAANPIRFFRVGPTASTGFPLWHNPFAVLTDNTLTALVGPGMTSAAGTLTMPIPFIQQLLTVGGGNVVPAVAAAGSNKADQVTGRLYDIRATSSRTFTGAGASAALSTNLVSTAIPNTTKDWAADLGATATWQAFSSLASPIEFRVTTSSSITNAPFTRVHIVRLSGGEWHYMGDMDAAGILDQGGNRFWRYTFSGGAGATQGGGAAVAALAGGDVIRAIGVDANGNALSTANVTFGLANALAAGTTVTSTFAFNAAAPFTTLGNAGAPIATTLDVSANGNAAALVAGCSTTSTLITVSMGAGNVCTITPAGVVPAGGSVNATITFTVTGSATGFTTNSITRSVTITRIP